MESFFLFNVKNVSNNINFNLIDVQEILVSIPMIEFCPHLFIIAVGLEILIWTTEQWEQLCIGLNLTIHVKYIPEREARGKTSKPSWLITPAYFFLARHWMSYNYPTSTFVGVDWSYKVNISGHTSISSWSLFPGVLIFGFCISFSSKCSFTLSSDTLN